MHSLSLSEISMPVICGACGASIKHAGTSVRCTAKSRRRGRSLRNKQLRSINSNPKPPHGCRGTRTSLIPSQTTADPVTGDDNITLEDDPSDSALFEGSSNYPLHACKSSTLPGQPSLRKPSSPRCHLLRILTVVQAALTAHPYRGRS